MIWPSPRVITQNLTADGYFSKVKFVDGVVALNLDLISKLRRDADARYLYTGTLRRGVEPPAATPVKVELDPPATSAVFASPWLSPTRLLRLENRPHLPFRLSRRVRVVVVISPTGPNGSQTSSLAPIWTWTPCTLYRRYDKARFPDRISLPRQQAVRRLNPLPGP